MGGLYPLKRSWRVLALSAAAASLAMGCGPAGSNVDDNHGYGYAYDLVSTEGVRFRGLPGGLELDAGQFEQLVAAPYRETEACAQITAPGPLVVVTHFPDEASYPVIGHGIEYSDTGLILVNPLAVTDSANFAGDPRDPSRLPGTSILRHEFVHYLLAASGFPPAMNHDHQSPLFLQCAGI